MEISTVLFITPFLSFFSLFVIIVIKVSNMKHVPFLFTKIKTVDVEKVDGIEINLKKCLSR